MKFSKTFQNRKVWMIIHNLPKTYIRINNFRQIKVSQFLFCLTWRLTKPRKIRLLNIGF
ncbi:unnamed protein product [Schistosoma mattheei]|uniref:Uncharacterized protein n=2 Tax=Schistosoma TaxID=6181 RepID=A0A3P8GX61_9TREM|nr:unnamed protein product [Schistosoma mattheei]